MRQFCLFILLIFSCFQLEAQTFIPDWYIMEDSASAMVVWPRKGRKLPNESIMKLLQFGFNSRTIDENDDENLKNDTLVAGEAIILLDSTENFYLGVNQYGGKYLVYGKMTPVRYAKGSGAGMLLEDVTLKNGDILKMGMSVWVVNMSADSQTLVINYKNKKTVQLPSVSVLLVSHEMNSLKQMFGNYLSKNERPPRFPFDFQKFLNKKLIYPYQAKKVGKEGTVMISYIVNRDGRMSNFKPQSAHGYGLEDEAIRVLKLIPKMIPATRDGEPIDEVTYKVLITFALKQ